jgi:predicted AlkP superfamily pyrophosphatase or phosphodiesterase
VAEPPKLVLCVIDAMAPALLERAVAANVAPVLGELMRRGHYVRNCAAAFPSVTPVCAASIATGVAQDRHRIPAMNWYHREEGRYVEYGSSFRASQRFRIAPPAHRHRLQHEPGPSRPRDPDGLRGAR